MYQLVKIPHDDSFITIIKSVGADGSRTFIPMVEDNTDYQEYLKWLEEGNEPLPADEPISSEE